MHKKFIIKKTLLLIVMSHLLKYTFISFLFKSLIVSKLKKEKPMLITNFNYKASLFNSIKKVILLKQKNERNSNRL